MQALYAQFDVLDDFGSIQGALKEELVDLVQQLSETESDLEVPIRTLKKKEITFDKLLLVKKETDDTNDFLMVDLKLERKKHEAEIIKVQEDIDQLVEKNKILKKGEGIDIEVLIWLAGFAPIKDLIEDSAGEDLIQQIKEIHHGLDLLFLLDSGVKPSEATDKGEENVVGKNSTLTCTDTNRAQPDSTKNSLIDGKASWCHFKLWILQ